MGPLWLDLLLVLVVGAAWAAFRLPSGRRAVRWLARRAPARRPAQPVDLAPGRPIELIVRDARRFGRRFHHPPRGTSFAKLQAVSHTYDRVLVEACHALGIAQLLEVLPPGEERDAERARVEASLWLAGLRIDEVA